MVVVVSVAVVLILVAVVAMVVASSGHDKASADDVALESVSEPGPDPYTPSVATTPPTSAATSSTTTTALSVPPATGNGVRTYIGAQPGLYGGTRDYHSCDPERMIDFLYANPDKLAAWAGVEGISTADVRSYIEGLTSVLLRTDTWVTNHGFSHGHATTLISVLQAGTAVLVDQYGVPRAKCFCGNPLTVVERYDYAPHYTGTPWSGFDPKTVVIIQPSTTIINQLTIIDVYTGKPFHRPFGHGPDTPAEPTTSTTTTSTTSTTAPPSTAAPTTAAPETQPPDGATGDWTLDAHYEVHIPGTSGTASWNAPVVVSSSDTISGTGEGTASLDGTCVGSDGQQNSTWHGDLPFRVAATGQVGNGTFHLGVQNLGGDISITFSNPDPSATTACGSDIRNGVDGFLNGLVGSVDLQAVSGSSAPIGASNTPGTVTLTR